MKNFYKFSRFDRIQEDQGRTDRIVISTSRVSFVNECGRVIKRIILSVNSPELHFLTSAYRTLNKHQKKRKATSLVGTVWFFSCAFMCRVRVR